MEKIQSEDVTKYIVQDLMEDEFSTDVLHRPLFDVNIRLLKENSKYKGLINLIIAYMKRIMVTNFDNYAPLKGLSGANVGIPFNIIAVAIKSNNIHIFINPKILKSSDDTTTIKSNCGSIRLKESISVERADWINLEWYDSDGERKTGRFDGRVGNTIQHETEHNLGILITDKG